MYSQPMTADAEPLKRLGHYVERRIAELGLEYAAVCRAAGFSDETLSKIRKGIGVRSSTYRKLEIALRWETLSIDAILAGGEPTPLATDSEQQPSEPEETQALTALGYSPGEALRRVVRASARELGITPNEVDEVMQLVRQDLEDEQAVTVARTDLSDLVREGRRAAGLSLGAVAASAVDPASGERVVDADWLDRLERAALDPTEHPEYPQLDALVDALHLDPELVQEAAGSQFMDVHTVWSSDGEARALVLGELSAEDYAKVQNLMRLYRKAPRDADG